MLVDNPQDWVVLTGLADLLDHSLPHTTIWSIFVQKHATDEGKQEAENGGAPNVCGKHLHPGQQHRQLVCPDGARGRAGVGVPDVL